MEVILSEATDNRERSPPLAWPTKGVAPGQDPGTTPLIDIHRPQTWRR